MELSELVEIGRLGKLDSDNLFCAQIKHSFESVLNQLQKCFLIFNSHRVFFVTVSEIVKKGRRLYLRFEDDGIDDEVMINPNPIIAIDREDLPVSEESDRLGQYFGYRVSFQDSIIGELSGAIENSMQSVLIIGLLDGRELMVPYVDQYVRDIDNRHKTIELINIEQLLEICTSMS